MGSVVRLQVKQKKLRFIRPGSIGMVDAKLIRDHLLLADRRIGDHAMQTVREAERMRVQAGLDWADILE